MYYTGQQIFRLLLVATNKMSGFAGNKSHVRRQGKEYQKLRENGQVALF
ncbi:MAG: hypothetical protein ABTQ25_08120 [Nitrosomonas ureae]